MQFQHPGMFSLLALIPVLILIHLLKPKPKPVQTTALFLWHPILKERGSSRRLERLKKNLPLFLQILIVLLSAAALARPVLPALSPQSGNRILVVDTSASMKTRTDSGTRFDKARIRALELIDQKQPEQKVLIIEAGTRPALRTGFLEDAASAREQIRRLEPTDARGDLKKALFLGLSFLDPTRNDTLYLITDGAGCRLQELIDLHPRIVPVLLSGGERNVGITRFEFRRRWDRSDAYEVMLEVKNFSPGSETFWIRLFVDKTPVAAEETALREGEKKRLIFHYAGPVGGIATAKIEIHDDLSVDDSAYLALSGTKDIWILLVSKGNYFLEKLLQSYPNVRVNTVKEIIPTSWSQQVLRHDIVIVDRMDFPDVENGNLLLIDALSPALPAKRTGWVDFPRVLDIAAENALTEGLLIDSLIIERAPRLQTGYPFRPLIESSETGLMYAYEKDALRAVLLNFDIARSDLPLKVAFPVLMSNILNWLNPNTLEFSTLYAKAGDPFDIHLNPQTDVFSIRTPSGVWERFDVGTHPFRYAGTRAVGIYTLSENRKRRQFTVNLVDETESDIRAPAPVTTAGRGDPTNPAQTLPVEQPLWAVIILLALVTLLVEWRVWLKVG